MPKGWRMQASLRRAETNEQENFTGPNSCIIKRIGGSFDLLYGAQTVVDKAVHRMRSGYCR